MGRWLSKIQKTLCVQLTKLTYLNLSEKSVTQLGHSPKWQAIPLQSRKALCV